MVVIKNLKMNKIGMASQAVYQVVVKGVLDENWRDWFNGTLFKAQLETDGCPQTTLTCRVRDQAELLGILNRLNGLNLPILQVTLIKDEEVKNEK